MTQHTDPKTSLHSAALHAARARFDEIWDQWKAVDVKAQASAAVSGVLLMGLFAFLRDWKPRGTLRVTVFILTLALVLAATLLAILALRIRFVAAAPHERLATIAQQAVAADEGNEDALPDRLVRFMSDERTLWDEASVS